MIKPLFVNIDKVNR